jgi:hypothetical protein
MQTSNQNSIDLDGLDFDIPNKYGSNRNSAESGQYYLPNYIPDMDIEPPSVLNLEDISDYSDSNSIPREELYPGTAEPGLKKRGRKSKRPHLRGKKTEDLDKYWIRRFRAYLRKSPERLAHSREMDFWAWFLSKEAEPGLSGVFKSYSKQHRLFLRSK